MRSSPAGSSPQWPGAVQAAAVLVARQSPRAAGQAPATDAPSPVPFGVVEMADEGTPLTRHARMSTWGHGAQAGPPQRPAIQLLPRITNAVTASANRVRAFPARASCSSKASSENPAPDAANTKRVPARDARPRRTLREPSLESVSANVSGGRAMSPEAEIGGNERQDVRYRRTRKAVTATKATAIATFAKRRRDTHGSAVVRGSLGMRRANSFGTPAQFAPLRR